MRLALRCAAALLSAISLVLGSGAASAMKIQSVKSPGGIEAWLVEEHSVPIFAMHFVFTGGSAQDPADKPGVATFLTSMLDEGAGDLDHTAFQEKLDENAVKMRFDASRDRLYGSFETLTANRVEGLALLKLAMTKPRLAPEDVERLRAQHLTGLAFAERDPDKVAARAWYKLAFGDHPYGRPSEGTKESLAKIAREDLESFRRRTFARDNVKIAVVGDIDAKTLGTILDDVFGSLEAKAQLAPVPAIAAPFGPKESVIEMDVPQSVAQFGHGGMLRDDPDFMAAFMLNYIIGGGGFSSRLMEEVREKRGLAYSVWTQVFPYDQVGVYLGGVSTKNESIGTSIDVIKAELKKIAENGPTPEDVASAKSYLTGSYPLRFDTSSKIAGQLIAIQVGNYGIDYVNRRNKLIEALTMDDLKRVAKRLIKSDQLIVTIVGKPKAAAPAGTAPAPATAPVPPRKG
jgi:zinc protease